MRRCLGGALGILILSTGIVTEIFRRLDQTPSVVCAYAHHPTHPTFEKLIQWLRARRFTFVSDRDVMDFIYNARRLPPRSIWLSFDDGRKSLVQNVVPVLGKYQIPATFFICPEAVERGCLWYELYNLHFFPKLKTVQDFHRITCADRNRLLDSILQPGGRMPARTIMTPENVTTLAREPFISFQNHTYSHPLLSGCKDEEIAMECTLAAEKILQWTGRPPDVLSYPCGDFREDKLHLLQQTGIKMAVTCAPEFLNPKTLKDPLLTPRTAFTNNGSLAENICQILGVWQPFINRIKRGHRSRRPHRAGIPV